MRLAPSPRATGSQQPSHAKVPAPECHTASHALLPKAQPSTARGACIIVHTVTIVAAARPARARPWLTKRKMYVRKPLETVLSGGTPLDQWSGMAPANSSRLTAAQPKGGPREETRETEGQAPPSNGPPPKAGRAVRKVARRDVPQRSPEGCPGRWTRIYFRKRGPPWRYDAYTTGSLPGTLWLWIARRVADPAGPNEEHRRLPTRRSVPGGRQGGAEPPAVATGRQATGARCVSQDVSP